MNIRPKPYARGFYREYGGFVAFRAGCGDARQGLSQYSSHLRNCRKPLRDAAGRSDKGFRSLRVSSGAISICQCRAWFEEATDVFRSAVQVLGRLAHMIPTRRMTDIRPIKVSHDCRRNGSGQRDRDMLGSYRIYQFHTHGKAVNVPVEIKPMIAVIFPLCVHPVNLCPSKSDCLVA